MGELFSGFMAIISGGATGLLGVVAQRLFDHWKTKQENDKLRLMHEHEEKMRAIDVQVMREEWAQRVKVAEVEGASREAVADSQAFAASFNEPQRYSEGVKVGKWGAIMLVMADFCRAIVRPGLTVYLAWIATEIYYQSDKILQLLNITVHQQVLTELHKQIVLTLLYLFVTCVCWWFGTRNKAKPPRLG